MLLLLLLYSIEVLCELLRRQSFSIEPWVSHYIIDIVAICVIKLKHVKQKISNTFFRHLGPLVYLGIVNWISFSTWHLNGVFRFISVLIQAKSTIPTVHQKKQCNTKGPDIGFERIVVSCLLNEFRCQIARRPYLITGIIIAWSAEINRKPIVDQNRLEISIYCDVVQLDVAMSDLLDVQMLNSTDDLLEQRPCNLYWACCHMIVEIAIWIEDHDQNAINGVLLFKALVEETCLFKEVQVLQNPRVLLHVVHNLILVSEVIDMTLHVV